MGHTPSWGGLTLDPILANNSWEAIAYAAEKGLAADTWNIGDTIDVQVGDETLTFAIMDFNHDDLADGSGKAGITFGMKELMANTHNMNSTNTNVGSFVGSEMYAYLRDTVLPSMPQEVQSVIKPVNKRTTIGGASTEIQVDSMFIWLFSVTECGFPESATVVDEGIAYPYYTDATRQKGVIWWLRSPFTDYTSHFYSILESGKMLYFTFAREAYGVTFGFCV